MLCNGYVIYYRVNDSKSTLFKEFWNADRELKLIRSAGKLFRKLTRRLAEKKQLKLF